MRGIGAACNLEERMSACRGTRRRDADGTGLIRALTYLLVCDLTECEIGTALGLRRRPHADRTRSLCHICSREQAVETTSKISRNLSFKQLQVAKTDKRLRESEETAGTDAALLEKSSSPYHMVPLRFTHLVPL